jgi:hypothetical protein
MDFIAKETKLICQRFKEKTGYPLDKEALKTLEGMAKAETEAGIDYINLLSKFVEGVSGVSVLFNKAPVSQNKPGTPKKSEPKAQKKKGPYRKTRSHHLHIVEFVLDTWASSNRPRIDWPLVTAKWNESHPPDDQFLKPIALKSLYNKSIREETVLCDLIFFQIEKGSSATPKARRLMPIILNQGIETAKAVFSAWEFVVLSHPEKRQLAKVTLKVLSGFKRKEAKNAETSYY